MKKYTILLIAIILIASVSLSAQSFKVIVNNTNSVSSLAKTEVSNYLLKKRTKWSNGTDVIAVDLGTKSSARATFSKDILGKTVAQVRAYWQQSVFSGKDTPPREMESDNAVLEFVKANHGAIGYVSANANTDGVKVISVK